MTRFRIFLLAIFLLLLNSRSGFAQIGITHEVGVLVGPASIFTDYGERWNVKNNLENAGLGIGLVHYMTFGYRARCNIYATENFFSDHFKIRTEFDYFYSDLEHFGPVASKDSDGGRLLRAMHGRTSLYEVGAALEYYPLSIRDFSSFAFRFSPYINLGVHYVYYNPGAYSDFGDLNNPKNVFPTFQGGMDFTEGTTWTIAGSVGLRYRFTVVSDLVAEARWQYYDTDWIDGLNINAPQNKFNDFLFWFNVGYVYYLNY